MEYYGDLTPVKNNFDRCEVLKNIIVSKARVFSCDKSVDFLSLCILMRLGFD